MEYIERQDVWLIVWKKFNDPSKIEGEAIALKIAQTVYNIQRKVKLSCQCLKINLN